MTQQPEPVFIDIVEPPPNPAAEIVDVLVGSFGLAGVILILALIIGVGLGGVMLWLRSRNPLGGA
jgi:hypothetical protein